MIACGIFVLVFSFPTLIGMNYSIMDLKLLPITHQNNATLSPCYLQQADKDIIQYLTTFLPLTDQISLSMTCQHFFTLACRTDTMLRPLHRKRRLTATEIKVIGCSASVLGFGSTLGGLMYLNYLTNSNPPQEVTLPEKNNAAPYDLIVTTALFVAGCGGVYLTAKIGTSQWYRNYEHSKELTQKKKAADKKAQALARITTAYEAIARRIKDGTLTVTNELHIDYHAPHQAAPLLAIVKSHRIPKLTITISPEVVDSYSIKLYPIIAYNTTLRSLAIEEASKYTATKINTENLCRGLRYNDHLTELSLNTFDSQALHPIIRDIATKPAIKKLSLQSCDLDQNDTLTLLSQAPLEHIQLRRCLSDYDIPNLLLLMKNSKTLRFLDISHNTFTRSGMQRITTEKPAHIYVTLDPQAN